MKIAIAGAGPAGMLASLLLARAGHEVLLLDQDRVEADLDVESAAARAFRASAPHIVQPHAVMARCRELLRDRLPDVYSRLIDAGALEAPLSAFMPPALADRASWPGDDRLTPLLIRRSTLDWVLSRAVLDEPGVESRSCVRVTGLTALPGKPPRVTGLSTSHGDVYADLVVDATGRRSPLGRWLVEFGARPPAIWKAECGLAYFGRHYRLRRTADLPGPVETRLVLGLDGFTAVLFAADNSVMQLAIAPLAADRRFVAVRQPRAFSAVLRTIPAFAAWLDVLDPITPVYPMGGLHNTLRRLVADGAPVVTGLHAIGDSVCTTNPTLGRGLSLALQGAAALTDTLAKYPGDGEAQALALDDLVTDEVAPYYEDQAVIDAERLAMLRHTIFGAPAPAPAPAIPDRVTFAQLRVAATVDPIAFRAFWRILGMTNPPDQVYSNPRVVAATRAVLAEPGVTPAMPQPSREQLEQALTALTG